MYIYIYISDIQYYPTQWEFLAIHSGNPYWRTSIGEERRLFGRTAEVAEYDCFDECPFGPNVRPEKGSVECSPYMAYWCLVGNGWEWGNGGMGLLLIVIVDHSLIPCTSKQVFVEKRSAVKLPAMPTCTVMSTKAGDHKIAVFKPVALQIFGAMCPGL